MSASPEDLSGGAGSAHWDEWLSDRTLAARDALLEHYAPWCRMVVRDVYVRFRHPHTQWEDYVHFGTIGLIEALERYTPTRGASFETYARFRIRGAVLNGVRQFGDVGPRQRDDLRDRAESLSGDGDDALGEVVGLTIGLALGALLDLEGMGENRDADDPYTCAETASMREALMAYFKGLPDRERRILTLHYFQHVPFIEIAEMFGLSKGRIAQLHRRALERLRERFEAGLSGG